MTIHGDHPFLPPESERSPVRRFRARLASPVSLWTAAYDGDRAGLTVSSVMVADGEPGFVLGLIDGDTELWETLRAAGRGVVALLGPGHQQLADAFGYVAPAPGGPFRMAEWVDTDWGPVLPDVTWAGCVLADADPPQVGWGLEVRLEIQHVEPGLDQSTLAHRRGRYHPIP